MKAKLDYLEYVALPWYTQIGYKIWRFLYFIVFALVDLVVGLAKQVWSFIKKIGVSIKKMYISLRFGDWATKLSFLFVGTGYIKRGQIVKGILYLIVEVAFILFMILFGGKYFTKFFTLGSVASAFSCEGMEGVWATREEAEAAGCWFPIQKTVDISELYLLYGVIIIVAIIAFIIFYAKVTIGAFKVECNKEEGKHVNNFKEDVGELLNGKFHITLLTLPILGVLVFTIFPLIDMVLMAFTSYDVNHQSPSNTFDWVGLKNFADIFALGGGDSSFAYTFGELLKWTILWAILATFTNFILGVLVATIINRKGIKLKTMWRTFLVLSVALPQFVSLLAMKQFLSDNGIVQNLLYSWTGQKIYFMDNALIARTVVVVVNIWIGIPYTVLSTTGILMNIPADLYESAKIDGANAVVMYTKITIPYIFFVLGPSLITTFIGNVNNFGVIFLLTGGAPKTSAYYSGAGKTDILITWLWTLTKDRQLYNQASVVGLMIFFISAILSTIVYRNSSSFKNEEDFS